MAGVVSTTSPIRRSRTNKMRDASVVLDRGFVNEHYRNVVFDGVDALACGALERRAILDERDRRFAVGAGENLEQLGVHGHARKDRKSTRLNSSHLGISYAVFCLK